MIDENKFEREYRKHFEDQILLSLKNRIVELIIERNMTKEDFNSIPVEFCSKATCCSLNIKEDDDGGVYCDDCGGLKISKAPIDVWEEYWIMAHGEKLLNMNLRDATENSN